MTGIGYNSTYHLYVGRDPGAGAEWWNGLIDDVRIYNRALSAGEVQQLYHLGAANVGHSNTVALSSGLVDYWPLDGAVTNWTANTTNDISGNANTANLVSMSTTTSPMAGKIGQALKFDGISFVDALSNSSIQDTTPFTFSAWVIDNTGTGGIFSNAWQGLGGGAVLFAAGSSLYIEVTELSTYELSSCAYYRNI